MINNDAARQSTIHPSIAGFVEVVRTLEHQLSLCADPTQYVQILETNSKFEGDAHTPRAR
jgi:hypothetical protein